MGAVPHLDGVVAPWHGPRSNAPQTDVFLGAQHRTVPYGNRPLQVYVHCPDGALSCGTTQVVYIPLLLQVEQSGNSDAACVVALITTYFSTLRSMGYIHTTTLVA